MRKSRPCRTAKWYCEFLNDTFLQWYCEFLNDTLDTFFFYNIFFLLFLWGVALDEKFRALSHGQVVLWILDNLDTFFSLHYFLFFWGISR